MAANPNLKAAIAIRGTTQRQISITTEIPETRLSHIIKGRLAPTSDERVKLSRALRYSPRLLFGHRSALSALAAVLTLTTRL
jgi:plasmid maintenance system antidote protein VapI